MCGPIVRIESVTKRFNKGDAPALKEITANIQPNIITGLVGPDGAGKTTLLRLIAGLLSPTTGTIRVDGVNTAEDPQRLRGSIGYMPQKFGLYEDLSVIENLTLYADLRNIVGNKRQEAFNRLLSFTNLHQFTSRLAGRLSGGMKQKLGLACTLLGNPKLLLLDEPGVGVDPISRRELWKMVCDLTAQGISIIWSTAYLDEAELCQEVILLNEGSMLFNGPPKNLTNRVQKRAVQIRNLTKSPRSLLTQALRYPEVMDGVVQGQNLRLLLRDENKMPDLASLQAGENAKVVSVMPRFEDAFIDVLGGGPGGDSVLNRYFREKSRGHDVLIEARSLTKKFGTFTAADNISFKVKRGEIFGLLGPNGAGKSTTFKMMCGLLSPSSGTAHVLGLDLHQNPGRARQHLGYMAQKFSLYGNLTVKQNLEFFSGVYGLARGQRAEAVRQMIEVFHLGAFLKTTPDQLPLGFKQRLALACSVMHEPDILFLDEPTSGVDPITRREFWTHINGLVEKGVTVMVTTHFMDEAEYCDRVGLVYKGRLIALGTPDELKTSASTEQNPDPAMEDAFIRLIEKDNNESELIGSA